MMKNLGLEALAALASSVSAESEPASNNNRRSVSVTDNVVASLTPPTSSSAPSSKTVQTGHGDRNPHSNMSTNNPTGAISSDLARIMQNAAASLIQQSTLNGITPQQWQQMLTAAGVANVPTATSTNNNLAQPQQAPVQAQVPTSHGLGLSSLLSSVPNISQIDPSALQAVQQQFSIYQQLVHQQQVQSSQQNHSANHGFVQTNNNKGGNVYPTGGVTISSGVVPSSSTANHVVNEAARVIQQMAYGSSTPMNPIGGLSAPSIHHQPPSTTTITPQPTVQKADSYKRQENHYEQNGRDSDDDNSCSDINETSLGGGGGHDKKQQKRAANRRSAQLSRKRKKAFIEELKDENDDLRRKEQILKSIPDLVIVFDSSGKLWFVSQSVTRFIDYKSQELEGTSFWNRLCDDSVRLLKAAFMDSLAGRSPESDTVPLGNGFWELALIDRDGSQKVVTLNGVVHFAGDRPECVCSIRPAPQKPPCQENGQEGTESAIKKKRSKANCSADVVSSSASSCHQSVDSNGGGRGAKTVRREESREVENSGTIRISDSGNSSGSDSCGI